MACNTKALAWQCFLNNNDGILWETTIIYRPCYTHPIHWHFHLPYLPCVSCSHTLSTCETSVPSCQVTISHDCQFGTKKDEQWSRKGLPPHFILKTRQSGIWMCFHQSLSLLLYITCILASWDCCNSHGLFSPQLCDGVTALCSNQNTHAQNEQRAGGSYN